MKPKTVILVLVVGLLIVLALICSQITGGTSTPKTTPILGTGKLWLPDYEGTDMGINLWERGQADRGRVIAQGKHGAEVQVLEKRYEQSESRYYYRVRVTATGATGWVPETLIQVR